MSGIFDRNDLGTNARSAGYFIRRTDDSVTLVGGLMVYFLSGAMLITALQARMILFLRSVSGANETRLNDLLRSLGSPYRLNVLVRETQVDANWAGRTQTMLYLCCSLLGFPQSYLDAIALGFRQRQVNWESTKAAICLAFVLPSPTSAPAPGPELERAQANMTKLLASIELRYSNVAAAAGVTTTTVSLPVWGRALIVTRETPTGQTINAAMGVRFVSTASNPNASAPARRASIEDTTTVPSATLPQGSELPPERPRLPQGSTPPATPTTPTPTTPTPTPRPTPAPAQVPVRPTVTTGSSSGAAIGIAALLGIAAIAAVATGPKKSKFFG